MHRESIVALSITIAPAGDGWALQSSAVGLDRRFASGGRAEAEGRAFASHLAREGQATELKIVLRDGTVAAVIPFGEAAAA
jgi:hypothetical protein